MFKLVCSKSGEERELNDYSTGDEGIITIEMIGSDDTLLKIEVACKCGEVVGFDRF